MILCNKNENSYQTAVCVLIISRYYAVINQPPLTVYVKDGGKANGTAALTVPMIYSSILSGKASLRIITSFILIYLTCPVGVGKVKFNAAVGSPDSQVRLLIGFINGKPSSTAGRKCIMGRGGTAT